MDLKVQDFPEGCGRVRQNSPRLHGRPLLPHCLPRSNASTRFSSSLCCRRSASSIVLPASRSFFLPLRVFNVVGEFHNLLIRHRGCHHCLLHPLQGEATDPVSAPLGQLTNRHVGVTLVLRVADIAQQVDEGLTQVPPAACR